MYYSVQNILKFLMNYKYRILYRGIPIVSVLLFFLVIASIISRCYFIDTLKFLLVQVAFLFVPGYALQRVVGLRYENKLVRLLVSYATGYALSIIVYLFLLMCGVPYIVVYFYSAISVLSIISILIIKRKGSADRFPDINEVFYFSLVLFISLCIACVLFQCGNLSPIIKEGNAYVHPDFVFWMRNSIAATKSYPLPDLSVMGRELHYHYFTSVEMAFLKYVSGVEMLDLCFTYSYIVSMLLVTSGLYVLADKLIVNSRKSLLACCFILFTANFDMFTWINLTDLIYSPFGFGDGLAFFCFSLYYYFRMIEEKDVQWKIFPILVAFFFVTTGLKGTIASILLFGFAYGSLYMMIKEKRSSFGIISGVLLLFAFLIPLQLYVMGEAVEAGSGRSVSFSFVGTLFYSGYFYKLYLLIGSIIWYPLAFGLTFVLYLLLSLAIPIFLFVFFPYKWIIGVKDQILITIILVGILLGMFVAQGGMSQSHFFCVAIVCLFLYFFKIVEIDSLRWKKPIISIFIIGLMLFGVYHYKRLSYGIDSYLKTVSKSPSDNLENIFVSSEQDSNCFGGSNDKLQNNIVDDRLTNRIMASFNYLFVYLNKEHNNTGLTLTKNELYGLRWCRDNLPDNSILLSNKMFGDEEWRSFWVSSISERQTFEESYAYSNVNLTIAKNNIERIRKFYKGDPNIQWLKNKKVNYAVIFKNIIPNKYPKECKVVFENIDLIVVEI